MSSKAMTIRIFDSKTDESVVIITDAKKSRIRELVAVKGSFWDIVKKMEDSLREEGCRYKCVFDSRTDKEDIAVAIGWSDGLDVHEDIGEAFDAIKDRLLTQFTEALHDSDMHVIDGDADSMIVRASNGGYCGFSGMKTFEGVYASLDEVKADIHHILRKMFREKRDDAEIRMRSADRVLRMIRTLGNAADKKGD